MVLACCPHCGHDAFDAPVAENDEGYAYPELSVNGAQRDDVVVRFTNPHDGPMSATIFLAIWRIGATVDEEQLFDPSRVDRTLAPGETATVEFDLNLDRLEENQHYVLCRVIGNLAVYSTQAVLPIGESRSHLNPAFRE